MEAIYLTDSELEKLFNKKVGQGGEGAVFKAGNGILYKIYHNESSRRASSGQGTYQAKEMKIVKSLKEVPQKREFTQKFSSYTDKEGVKIHPKNAIILAAQRQNLVEHSSLPLAPIYTEGDNRFIGCALKEHKHHFGIYHFSSLPLKLKIGVLKKLLRNVEELIKANIYHVDLNNKEVGGLTHSNILLSFALEPQIIDIDGTSAIYTEKPSSEINEEERRKINARNEFLKTESLRSFGSFLIDFLYEVDMLELEEEIDYWAAIERLVKKGLPQEFIDEIFNGSPSYEMFSELLNLKLKR